MSRLWEWYRGRRLWVRIVIAAPAGLVALVALYLVARALQYRSASQADAAAFVPEEAQVVVRATGGARTWKRLRDAELWKIVRTKMLRDAALRREINETLKEFGAPTLDDLEDARFVERTGGMLTEDQLLRFAGRDVAASLRFPEGPGAARLCVATKVGFWDYALLPFAPLALKKVELPGGRAAYKVGGLHVSIVGAIAVVSDDKALLASALRKRGRAGPSRKPVEASIAFERSPALAEWRKLLERFAIFADGGATRATATFDFDGADVVLDARIEGLTSASEAPADAARYVPSAGMGAVLLPTTGERLMQQAPSLAEALEMEGIIRDALRKLEEVKLPSRLGGPTTVILGSATGVEGRTFASCAMVLRCEDASGAAHLLGGVIEEMIKGAKKSVRIVSQMVQGQTVWALDFGADPFRDSDYRRPCWATYGGALIVTNNLEFMMKVMTTAVTEQGAMTGEGFHRAAESRLTKLGMARVLKEGTAASGFLYGPAIREGLEGFWPELAKMADNDKARQKVRAELEAEWRKSGRNPAGQDFNQEVYAVMAERVGAAERRWRDSARAIDYLRWAAFEATAEEGAIRLRAALELK